MPLSGLHLVENDLKGYVTLPFLQHQADAVLSMERKVDTTEEYAELIENANTFLENMSKDSYDAILHEMAIELTESAYSQGGYRPSEADVSNLEKELVLIALNFDADSILLVFGASQNYPDMHIYCQVDQEGNIEDISVADIN